MQSGQQRISHGGKILRAKTLTANGWPWNLIQLNHYWFLYLQFQSNGLWIRSNAKRQCWECGGNFQIRFQCVGNLYMPSILQSDGRKSEYTNKICKVIWTAFKLYIGWYIDTFSKILFFSEVIMVMSTHSMAMDIMKWEEASQIWWAMPFIPAMEEAVIYIWMQMKNGTLKYTTNTIESKMVWKILKVLQYMR